MKDEKKTHTHNHLNNRQEGFDSKEKKVLFFFQQTSSGVGYLKATLYLELQSV